MPRPRSMIINREELWNLLMENNCDLGFVRAFLGISKPTLYRYMANFGITALEVRQKLTRDRIAAIDGHNMKNVQDRLRTLIQSLQEFQESISAVFVHESHGNSELDGDTETEKEKQ